MGCGGDTKTGKAFLDCSCFPELQGSDGVQHVQVCRGGGGEDGRGRRGRRRSREGRKTLLRCTSLSGPAGMIQLSTAPLAGREPASLHWVPEPILYHLKLFLRPSRNIQLNRWYLPLKIQDRSWTSSSCQEEQALDGRPGRWGFERRCCEP